MTFGTIHYKGNWKTTKKYLNSRLLCNVLAHKWQTTPTLKSTKEGKNSLTNLQKEELFGNPCVMNRPKSDTFKTYLEMLNKLNGQINQIIYLEKVTWYIFKCLNRWNLFAISSPWTFRCQNQLTEHKKTTLKI